MANIISLGKYIGLFITIMPNGVLYACAGNTIYISYNHGFNWTALYSGNVEGVNPADMVAPTSAGFVVISTNGSQFFSLDLSTFTSTDNIEGSLSTKNNFVFVHPVTGVVWTTAVYSHPPNYDNFIALSIDGGRSYRWCNSGVGLYGGSCPPFYRIAVNNASTLGWAFTAFAGGSDIPISSVNPTGLDGNNWTLANQTLGYRCWRPGISFPNIVLPASQALDPTHYAVSTNNGANFAAQAIPAGMQNGNGDFECDTTCNGNTVLTHLLDSNTPGIYRSSDLGVTWAIVSPPLSSDADYTKTGVQIDPFNTNYVYAWGKNGFYVSTDAGNTFNQAGTVGLFLPGVQTTAATGISQLNGILTYDGGQPCACGFQWGYDSSALNNTTPTVTIMQGSSFSQVVSGTGAVIFYRAVATNTDGTAYGNILSTVPLSVSTLDATQITDSQGQLNGLLSSGGGVPCTTWFEWGGSIAYGQTTKTETHVTGDTFSAVIQAGQATVIHFRAVAQNQFGTAYGQDKSFSTLSANNPGGELGGLGFLLLLGDDN